MRVGVIGSGGREHALVWKLAQSKHAREVHALPGNPGMTGLATLHDVKSDAASLLSAIQDLKIEFVVVGPEQPLAEGLIDELEARKIACFGPVKAAARLESSKVFSKELMKSCGVPTADFRVFDDFEQFEKYVVGSPRANGRVVKADGLAAGKGAFVCADDAEALDTGRKLLVDRLLGKPERELW